MHKTLTLVYTRAETEDCEPKMGIIHQRVMHQALQYPIAPDLQPKMGIIHQGVMHQALQYPIAPDLGIYW